MKMGSPELHAPQVCTLQSLLADCGLSDDLAAAFAAKTTLADLRARLAANRPHLLAHVKELGIAKLPDRQKLANAIARAEKAGQMPAAALAALPHLRPPVYEEAEDRVSVRLKVPAGTTTHQLRCNIDANSVRVEYCGERTAACGRLCGHVLPSESDWEIERTPAPEYDPLREARDQQPEALEDTLVITLHKARAERWVSLFSDALSRRHEPPPPPPEDEAALALKRERQVLIDRRKHEMLYGKELTPMPPKRPELLRLEERERVEHQRRRQRRAELEAAHGDGGRGGRVQATGGACPTLWNAEEHWQSARATLLWRTGLARHAGAPEHPADCDPLYVWYEDAHAMVVRSSTARGTPATALKLQAGSNFVECFVRGVRSMWSGVLVGKIEPSSCRLEVLPPPSAEETGAAAADTVGACCDTLQLTLVKAEPRGLWLAPWPELLDAIEKRERSSAVLRDKPRREELEAGGWDAAQADDTWQLIIPFRSGGRLTHDDLRVGVTADALNVHVAGQQHAPLLGGELHARIDLARSSWSVRTAAPIGSVSVDEMVITLIKERKATWPRLFKRMYA